MAGGGVAIGSNANRGSLPRHLETRKNPRAFGAVVIH